MRTLLVISCLISLFFAANAQTVQYSIPFDEPRELESKVFQCSNGNTMLFTFTKGNGIKFTLYDTTRKVKVKKEMKGNEWESGKMESSEVKAIYEIGGNVVLFLQQLVGKKPMLFRIIIDAQNGRLIQEKKIADMDKYGFASKYALAFGTDPKTFHVMKDVNSGCYAVVRFDGFASADENRIEITHYSGTHEEINRAEYKLPAADDYKYIRYLGMSVDSNRSVYMATYAFDTRSSGGKHSKVFFSRINKEEKDFFHKPLDITEDFKQTFAVLQFNGGMQTLDMLLLTELETKSSRKKFMGPDGATTYYGLLHASLDAASMDVKFMHQVDFGKLSGYKKSVLKSKDNYTGLPQNMIINNDHTTTITFEEIASETYSNGRRSSTSYFLGDIGILDLNSKGEEANGYVIKKSHLTGFKIKPLDQYDRARNFMAFERQRGLGGWTNSGFYSFDIVNTGNARYIIYNDNPANLDKSPEDDVAGVGGISGTHTICHKLVNGKSEKFLLFDTPKGNKKHFSFINSSHYLAARNTYAVMVVEQAGREKKARVAWVQFD